MNKPERHGATRVAPASDREIGNKICCIASDMQDVGGEGAG